MSFHKKIIIVFLAAIVFEFGWCQRSAWLLMLNKNTPKDIYYELSEMEFVNWEKTANGYISLDDPIIYIPTNPLFLFNVEFRADVSPKPASSVLYYTDKNGAVKTEESSIHNGLLKYSIGKPVSAVLRVDIGEHAGLVLNNAEAIINSTTVRPSVSRIIAVILIYMSGSLLFRIQRMPDYTKYIQEKE